MKQLISALAIFGFLSSFGQDNALGLKISTKEKLAKTHITLLPKSSQGSYDNIKIISENFPPIQNQGSIGSCASWASVYAIGSYVYKLKEGYSYYSNGLLDENKVFSPLYVFNKINLNESNDCKDVSSYTIDNLEFMLNQGMCKKTSFDPHPYQGQTCFLQPSNSYEVANEARNYKIDNYSTVIDPNEIYSSGRKLALIKEFITKNYPLIIGVEIDKDFWEFGGDEINYNGKIINFWDRYRVSKGRHAMVCVGYNDDLGAILIYNSWGTRWGNNGYGWISYDLIDDNLFEAFAVNVKEGKQINYSDYSASPDLSQANKKKKSKYKTVLPITTTNHKAVGKEFNKFILNRYIPYNNLRFMPVFIDKKNKSGVIKVFEESGDSIKQVDVFEIKKEETYKLKNEGLNYEFKLLDVKPYRLLGREAIHYLIQWN